MIDELALIIKKSDNIVFFGGAGVSTESGIKDFRSKDGLYSMKYDYPLEKILSHSFFLNNTDEFYKFYRDNLNCLNVSPNICHKFLTKLEKIGKLKAIITQNIDGLHQRSGSRNVLELHGSIYRNRCMRCDENYTPEYVFNKSNSYICDCGGIIKPDVVLYGESLDDSVVNLSIEYIEKADTLIVAGTSLTVYPASNFVKYFHGRNLIIINSDCTSYDNLADIVIHDKFGNVVSKIYDLF